MSFSYGNIAPLPTTQNRRQRGLFPSWKFLPESRVRVPANFTGRRAYMARSKDGAIAWVSIAIVQAAFCLRISHSTANIASQLGCTESQFERVVAGSRGCCQPTAYRGTWAFRYGNGATIPDGSER